MQVFSIILVVKKKNTKTVKKVTKSKTGKKTAKSKKKSKKDDTNTDFGIVIVDDDLTIDKEAADGRFFSRIRLPIKTEFWTSNLD